MIFLIDSKVLFGIGIGLILGVIIMFGYKYNNNLSDSQIEEKARALGMIYGDERKSILKGED